MILESGGSQVENRYETRRIVVSGPIADIGDMSLMRERYLGGAAG